MPCPTELAEWLLCKELQFRLLPSGLVPGEIDEQPAAAFGFWANLNAFYEVKKSRIEFKLRKDLERKASRGRGRR